MPMRAGQKMRASELAMVTCHYVATDATTTIATGATESVLKWATALETTPLVTVSGTGNTTFTMNASGIWIISATNRVKFVVNPTTGDFFLYAYIVASSAQICGVTTQAPVTLNPIPGCQTVRQFTSGDQIRVKMRNSTNQQMTLQNNAGELGHVSLTFLRAA